MHTEKSELLAGGRSVAKVREGYKRYRLWMMVSMLVLLAGLGGSCWLYFSLRKNYEHLDRVHLDVLTRDAQTNIQRRIVVYTNVMRAGRAMFNADAAITRMRWRSFVESLELPAYCPGIRGVGVVYLVPPEKAAEFAESVQARDKSDFSIKAGNVRQEMVPHNDEPLYIATYIGPEDMSDPASLGQNIAGDENRREAAEAARDTGNPVLTKRVNLTYEGINRSGLVLYLPVYDTKQPIGTLSQRRRAIIGWIYLPMITEEFFTSVLSKGSGEMELSFFEGNAASPQNLLYATAGARVENFERLNKLELVGREFTLGWNRRSQFHSVGGGTAIGMLVFSSLGSVLLAAFVANLVYTRQKAREALARQDIELAYQKFALDQHAIVAITDAAGTITYANDRFCALSGYSREELVGQNHRIIKSGLHPAEFYQQMYATIAQGKVWQGEICNRNRTGQLGWVTATIVPFPGPDGKPEKYVAIRSDITALKLAEEKLRQSQERLVSIFNSLEEGILLQEGPTKVVELNASAERILGLSRAQLSGTQPLPDWWQLIDKDGKPITIDERPAATTFRQGTAMRGTILGVKKMNGDVAWLSSNNEPIFDESGKVRAVVSSFHDITQSIQAKKALEESEARLRLFVDYAPASVAMFDREMHFLVASKRWIVDHKLEGQNIVGHSLYEVYKDMPEHWKEGHRRCMTGMTEVEQAVPYLHDDGSVMWSQMEGHPWHVADGSIGGIVIFTVDVTKRKELESSLEKARDDALEASRLKSEFLATMSHEIRTPMNGVIGMASLLAQTPLESRQREMAQALVNSAERLMVIINDILDFSKIEAGKMRIEPVEFNLRDVIEEATTLMAASAHQKGLHLTCDIDPRLGTGFLGDSGRIQQVVTNLLGNAIKFTEKGEVAISAIVLYMTDKISTFRIKIADTGVGIPDSAKEKLFQPFIQADGTTTRKYGGTGLGLAISAQLVSLMGGNIGFDSIEGMGSTFWVELGLPLVELPRIEISDKIPPEARVLVVDDHEVNRMVLMRQLASLNVSAEAASCAKDALDFLQREAVGAHPFTIVLLDWNMPETSGLGLAQLIRQDPNPKIAGLFLIVLSSTSETIDPGVTANLKFQSVLNKPVRENQLRRCLLRAYGRRATPTPFQRKQTMAGRGLRLLLAEDNETNQLVAQMTLEQLGHLVEVAASGQAALDRLAAEPFDAVLMDCQMPIMDGYEATRLIRAGRVKGLNPHIPIIALTAYAMPADKARVLKAGMDDFVAKPLSKETLHAALVRCGLIENLHKPGASDMVPPAESTMPSSQASASSPASLTQKPPIFDPSQKDKLRILKMAGGGTVWDKVRTVFLSEMPDRIEALQKHYAEKNSSGLGTVAHTIAGSAAIIGAPALRAAGLALEAAAGGNVWINVSALLDAVSEAWSQIQQELAKTDN